MSFIEREDKLKEYLSGEPAKMLFSELDGDFLHAGNLDFMVGVPIPIKPEDLPSFKDEGLSTTKIADNMALVIGADIGFKYREQYVAYLHRFFDDKLVRVFIQKAVDLIDCKEYRRAMCYLRSAVLFDENSPDALYFYASGCRFWYQSMEGEEEDEELIRLLKSEAIEYFAHVTDSFPGFAPAWYYLGFAYLNSGSYKKAQLAFTHYLGCCENQPEEDVAEVNEKLEALKDPVRIEEGVNLLVSDRIEEALQLLEPYVGSDYDRWWPLHFYLGTAYKALGYTEEAIEGFKRVLELNPSNYDACTELAELYESIGDEEMAEKYLKKSELVIN